MVARHWTRRRGRQESCEPAAERHARSFPPGQDVVPSDPYPIVRYGVFPSSHGGSPWWTRCPLGRQSSNVVVQIFLFTICNICICTGHYMLTYYMPLCHYATMLYAYLLILVIIIIKRIHFASSRPRIIESTVQVIIAFESNV